MADRPIAANDAEPEWDAVASRRAAEALIVDVDGFEGPLDLLLTLSRTQKVDLRRVSILQLTEQYLVFIEQARTLRIELAADYLVDGRLACLSQIAPAAAARPVRRGTER